MLSCALHLKAPNGNRSALYDSLVKNIGSRKAANAVYDNIHLKKASWKQDGLVNDEPTFEQAFALVPQLPALVKGHITQYITDKYKDANPKIVATRFMDEDSLSKYFTPVMENGKIVYKPIPEVINGESASSVRQFNKTLNSQLKSMLRDYGIAVQEVDRLEDNLTGGEIDFSVTEKTVDGLLSLIKILRGQEGEKALPEEFSHFAVRVLYDKPIVQRLINHIRTQKSYIAILGDEYEAYKNKYERELEKSESLYTIEDVLAEEALGKLLAQHLQKQYDLINEHTPKTLWGRFIQAVKDFFAKWDYQRLYNMKAKTYDDISDFARDILQNNLVKEGDKRNLQKLGIKLNQLTKKIDTFAGLLNHITKTIDKKAHLEAARYGVKVDEKAVQDKILSYAASTQVSVLVMINTYLADATQQMSEIINGGTEKYPVGLKDLYGDTTISFKQKCVLLRDIRDYIKSYQDIADILDYLSIQNPNYEQVKQRTEEFEQALRELNSYYKQQSVPLMVKFIEQYTGKSMNIKLGKDKGKTLTAEDILMNPEYDISLYDQWLNAAANSGDMLIKTIDKSVKTAKNNARLKTLDLKSRILAAYKKATNAGITSFDWMYEKKDDGSYAGYYIDSRCSWKKYREAKKAYIEEWEKKGMTRSAIRRKLKNWEEKNTVIDLETGERIPKAFDDEGNKLYYNDDFDRLPQAYKDFYNTFMDLKKSMDNLLPPNYTVSTRTVKIRQDLMERLSNAGGVKQGMDQIVEALKDQVFERSDDTEMVIHANITDFEDRQVQMLPVYFTRLMQGESEDDVSRDPVTTLVAYASMANDFAEMSDIIDSIEVVRDITKNRKPDKFVGAKRIMQGYSSEAVKEMNPNWKKRLDDYYNMTVYGHQRVNEGTVTVFGKDLSKTKLANVIIGLTAFSKFAFNFVSGIANVTNGDTMLRIEATAGQYFTYKNFVNAKLEFGKLIFGYMGDLGNPIKTNKLYLMMEKFNIMQDYESMVRGLDVTKSKFSKFFNSSPLYFMNTAGELFLNNVSGIAQLMTIELHDEQGNTISMYDALEQVYLQEDGTWGKTETSLGSKLIIDEKWKTADGRSADDISYLGEVQQSIAHVNQQCFGIYNKVDRNALQQYSIGSMIMMFRKYLIPALNRRYMSGRYSFDTQQWEEGYYRSFGRYLWACVRDLKDLKFNLATKFKLLSKEEQQNIIRAITELAHFMAAFVAVVLYNRYKDDDKDSSWLSKIVELTVRRYYTEIAALTPTTALPTELLRIMKSPSACVTTIEDLTNLLQLANPLNYEAVAGEDAVLQSGRFKGHDKAYKYFIKSPLTGPVNTIYRALVPDDTILFYKN